MSVRRLCQRVQKALELTLAILKPDVVKRPMALQGIRNHILENGFLVVKTRQCRLSLVEAEQFYSVHKGRFFYDRLVTFMCSGPIHVHVLAHEEAIERWRNLMGPTKTHKAHFEAPSSLRGLYGLSDTRNATHGSDAPETAACEISFFFPKFDLSLWYRDHEIWFRNNKVILDEEEFIHKPHRGPVTVTPVGQPSS